MTRRQPQQQQQQRINKNRRKVCCNYYCWSVALLVCYFCGLLLDETDAYLAFFPPRQQRQTTSLSSSLSSFSSVSSAVNKNQLLLDKNRSCKRGRRRRLTMLCSSTEPTMDLFESSKHPSDNASSTTTTNTTNNINQLDQDDDDDQNYLFDSETWNAYETIMNQVMTSNRVLKKDTMEDMKEVRDYILSNRPARSTVTTTTTTTTEASSSFRDGGYSKSNNDNSGTGSTTTTTSSSTSTSSSSSSPLPLSSSTTTTTTTLRSILTTQRKQFMETYQFTPNQFDYALRCFTYIGDFCAKSQTSKPIAVVWYKMKECGMIPKENCISTFMYVLSIDGEDDDNNNKNNNNNNHNNNGDNDNVQRLMGEVATFHDELFPPNEKTITLRIKSLIAQGNVQDAEAILESLSEQEGGGKLKRLRTFSPVMEHYCSVGDTSSILRLFRQMQLSSGVHFDAESYGLILGALARSGAFRMDAKPIDGAIEAGYSVAQGPQLFDIIANEIADDLMEISEAAAYTIFKSFQIGFDESDATTSDEENNNNNDNEDTCLVVPAIEESSTSKNGILIGRVTINDSTAMCPSSGAKLRLLTLDDGQRKHVHDTLLIMAELQHQEYIKTLKKKKSTKLEKENDFGSKELSRYSEWLETRPGKPFTAIVDGPNVAYFGHPNLHYSQIKLVVEELEKMGETPLVTMPEKYVSRRFRLGSGQMQVLSAPEIDIMEGLLNDGKMYVVPAKCLDDYYWMLASISNQTTACEQDGLCGLDVSPNDESGRLPGLRPLLISNDQMRDHKLDLLEPREFRRWCSCHIVNYNFSAIVEDEWEKRQVELLPADFFSREIQGNAHGSSEGLVWHFPVSGWAEPDRLCIYVKR